MTYGECRDMSLHLIHQESIAGVEIPGSYNNQQDYLNKIPGLINAAQMDLATTAKPIPAEVMLGDLTYEDKEGSRVYNLPADLWQRRGSGLLIPRHDYPNGPSHYERFNQCRMVGNTKLILFSCLPDNTILEYFRYPTRLSPTPADTDVLDNVYEAQEAVPYYVAAHLVMQDDAFMYATLYNEYTSKKSALHDRPQTEVSVVEDVYFGGIYGPWR